jgi:hypothetical protein
VGQEIETDAERSDRGCSLENPAPHAGAVQRKRKRASADSSPDDDGIERSIIRHGATVESSSSLRAP